MGNNLRKLRLNRGWTHEEAAQAMGVSRSQFIKLERNERRLTSDYIGRAARGFTVPEAAVIEDRGSISLVGYVGAGAEAHIYADAQGPFEDVPLIEDASDDTVAVQVRGDSLGALFNEWLVYYDDVRSPITADLVGKLCVVGLADGRILVKKIARGRERGRYDLWSNTEAPIHDAEIEWAARVKQMTPR